MIEICKILPLDTPNKMLIISKYFDDRVYDTFKHFYKTNKYNNIGFLLLTSLVVVILPVPDCVVGIHILSSWQNPHVGSLTCGVGPIISLNGSH